MCARKAGGIVCFIMKTAKTMTGPLVDTSLTTRPSVADDPRWARIVARDKTADGHLWYSVSDHGRLLPPVVPVANRQSEERTTARHPRECEGDRLSALQALQSRRVVD